MGKFGRKFGTPIISPVHSFASFHVPRRSPSQLARMVHRLVGEGYILLKENALEIFGKKQTV